MKRTFISIGIILILLTPLISLSAIDNNNDGDYALVEACKDDSGNGLAYVFKILKPDLDCLGSLTWTDISPNAIITGSFMIANVGDPGTELNWEIESHPTSWGIWTFVPSSGTGLTPEMGTLTVAVEVVAPSLKNKRYDGEIKVINSEDSNDFDIIPVSITTPKNKSLNSNYIPLGWLFDHFPNIFPILRQLLGL